PMASLEAASRSNKRSDRSTVSVAGPSYRSFLGGFRRAYEFGHGVSYNETMFHYTTKPYSGCQRLGDRVFLLNGRMSALAPLDGISRHQPRLFGASCGKCGCELRVKSGTRIIELLVSL